MRDHRDVTVSNALLEVGSVHDVFKCHGLYRCLGKKLSWGCGKENRKGIGSPRMKILPQVKVDREIWTKKDVSCYGLGVTNNSTGSVHCP